MLLESELTEGRQGVRFENFKASAVRVECERYRHQPANEVRIAVAAKMKNGPAGLVRSFQSLELYPDMTVAENVRTAVDRHLPGSDARGRPPISRTQAIRRSSARPRLSSRRPP